MYGGFLCEAQSFEMSGSLYELNKPSKISV